MEDKIKRIISHFRDIACVASNCMVLFREFFTEDSPKKLQECEKKLKSIHRLDEHVTKEIVEEAARKMDIKTVEMNYLLSSGEKGLFEDFLTSFSPVYASNLKIRKVLTDVIRTLALQGRMVFVGRGSVASSTAVAA